MKVKELIARLLDEPMHAEVKLHIAEEYKEQHATMNGYVFDIDSVDRLGKLCLITFTDWREDFDGCGVFEQADG